MDTNIELGLVRSITTSLNMIEGLRAVTFDRVKKAVLEDRNMMELRDMIHRHRMTRTFLICCGISTKLNTICMY